MRNPALQLGIFLAWWMDGLLSLVPEDLRRRMRGTPDRLFVEFTSESCDLALHDGKSGRLKERRGCDTRDAMEVGRLRNWLRNAPGGGRIILRMPAHRILRKRFDLPLAAESSTREIALLEIDRQTPFTEDRAYICFRPISRDAGAGLLRGELAACRRDMLDSELERCRNLGFEPDVIAVAGEEAEYELLSGRRGAAGLRSLRGSTWALVAAAIGLFLGSLYAPPLLQSLKIQSFEVELVAARGAAERAQAVRAETEALSARLGFLAESRGGRVAAADVLEELSRLLPEDTWVNRLQYRRDRIELRGESGNATRIIQILEQSPYFDAVQFQSPLTRNEATKRDVFLVSARVSQLIPG